MRRADGVARQHDAAVAAAEAAAHHLFERDLAAASVRRGDGSDTARIIGVGPADVEPDVTSSGRARQRRFERHGDAAVRAAAAVLGGAHDADAEPLEDIDTVEIRRAAGAVKQRRRRAARDRAPRRASRTAPDRRRRRPSMLPPADRRARTAGRADRGTAAARPAPRRSSSPVPLPMRLLSTVMPVGEPRSSRSTSKIENGRRSSGSIPRDVFSITNCPGRAAAAIAGAASASTL